MSLYPITAYIGLGANLGFPEQQLHQALWQLQNSDGVRLIAISNLYRSKALLLPGSPPQPDYINAAARISTSLPPRWLLRRLLCIEQKLGRTRERRWAPRMLDLDLLCYGQQRLRQPDLTLPHAEIHKRAFVLYPLRDIAAELTLPGLGPIQRLLQRCDCSGAKLYRRVKKSELTHYACARI